MSLSTTGRMTSWTVPPTTTNTPKEASSKEE